MMLCNVQINQYDLQTLTYSSICTHHRLHSNDENKTPFSWDIYTNWQNMMVQSHQTHNHGKLWQKWGKLILFEFDDEREYWMIGDRHNSLVYMAGYMSMKMDCFYLGDQSQIYIHWKSIKTHFQCMGKIFCVELQRLHLFPHKISYPYSQGHASLPSWNLRPLIFKSSCLFLKWLPVHSLCSDWWIYLWQ